MAALALGFYSPSPALGIGQFMAAGPQLFAQFNGILRSLELARIQRPMTLRATRLRWQQYVGCELARLGRPVAIRAVHVGMRHMSEWPAVDPSIRHLGRNHLRRFVSVGHHIVALGASGKKRGLVALGGIAFLCLFHGRIANEKYAAFQFFRGCHSTGGKRIELFLDLFADLHAISHAARSQRLGKVQSQAA